MNDEEAAEDIEAEAERMLKRIGWHPSEWKQIEIYAKMPPAKKVQLMFEWRRLQVESLKRRLRREHPHATDRELALLLQEHLDLVRETPRFG